MSDQTQTAPDAGESQASAEVLAILGESGQTPTAEVGTEEVKPESETGQETDGDQDQKTTPPESEDESDESDEDTSEDEDKSKDEEESLEFMIAGQKYTDIAEAARAINRISGDNTRLAGDIISLNERLQQHEQENETLKKKIQEWQDYYDAGDEEAKRPDTPDVAETVRKIITEEKQQEQNEKIREQFKTELDSLTGEKDYSVVLPHMLALAKDLGDAVQKISPTKLYKMARTIAKGDDSEEVLEIAQEMAKEKTTKALNKDKANKVIGGNGKKSPSIMSDETPLSPEVAAILA